MISKLCSCKLLCCVHTGDKRGDTNEKMTGDQKSLYLQTGGLITTKIFARSKTITQTETTLS